MGKWKVNFSLVSFHFLIILFLFSISLTVDSAQVLDDPVGNWICDLHLLNCGPEGRCVDSNTSIIGADCKCNAGWKEAQLGDFIRLPLCIPNCTFDMQCGGPTPPPPNDPPPECEFVFCNRGNCVKNGTGHACKCFPGASNLLSDPTLLCLDDCSFGADCHHLALGGPPSSNSGLPGKDKFSPPLPSPPSNKSGSNGSSAAPSLSRRVVLALTMMLLSALCIGWI